MIEMKKKTLNLGVLNYSVTLNMCRPHFLKFTYIWTCSEKEPTGSKMKCSKRFLAGRNSGHHIIITTIDHVLWSMAIFQGNSLRALRQLSEYAMLCIEASLCVK